MPFRYPEQAHLRKHGPLGYQAYRHYKPWLRDEFTFRCVYCLARERWYPDGAASIGVDHLVPRSIDASLECFYDNLVYACNRCNRRKSTVMNVLDPCTDAYAKHLEVLSDGSIKARTNTGRKLIKTFYLNEAQVTEFRRRLITALAVLRDLPDGRDDYVDWMGYPDDLPDLLILRPPRETQGRVA
jgi:hypothetical protein